MSQTKESIEKQLSLKEYLASLCPEKFQKPFLKAMKQKRLVLVGLQIGNGEVNAYIVPFLKANPDITSLSLLDNRVGPEGVQALSKIPTLTTLSIGCNWVGDLTAEVLSKNKTLSYLDMQRNQISDTGAEHLAKNTTLKTLKLTHNFIKEKGAVALSRNQTLATLWIEENPIELGKYNLLLADRSRKESHDKIKYAFLSVMTRTTLPLPDMSIDAAAALRVAQRKEILASLNKFKKMEETNDEKRSSLLFHYRHKSDNRLSNDLVKEILSYVKPKPFKVMI